MRRHSVPNLHMLLVLGNNNREINDYQAETTEYCITGFNFRNLMTFQAWASSFNVILYTYHNIFLFKISEFSQSDCFTGVFDFGLLLFFLLITYKFGLLLFYILSYFVLSTTKSCLSIYLCSKCILSFQICYNIVGYFVVLSILCTIHILLVIRTHYFAITTLSHLITSFYIYLTLIYAFYQDYG